MMNRLKQLRQEKGIKQAELAQILAVGQQAISKYENGQLDIGTDTIARLCQIFGVTADYLLGMSSQRTAQISDADAALVDAYHAAPDSIRTAIDALLQPYKEQEEASVASAG